MKATPALLLLTLLPGPLLAQAPTGAVRELRSELSEPDLNLARDVVILSEGFRSSEREAFFTLAREKVAGRIRTEQVARPLRQAGAWNFHFLFVSSYHAAPWRPGYPARDTAFASRVEGDGTLSCDDAAADALAAELAPDVDLVVVLIKHLSPAETVTFKERRRLQRLHRKYRPDPVSEDADVEGPGDVRANADVPTDGGRVRLTSEDTEVFVHEVGHAAFGLGDEYSEYEGEIPADERWEVALCPNLTCEPTGARWKHILPTPPVEGGGYYQRGVWRPKKSCRMNESRSRNFCPVCEAAIRGFDAAEAPRAPRFTSPAEGATLAAPRVTATLHELGLRPRWRQSGPDPVSFHLELRRGSATGREVWSDEYEGHLRTAALTKRLKTPGSYWLGLRADGLSSSSETTWRRVEVRLVAGDLVGAVEEGD